MKMTDINKLDESAINEKITELRTALFDVKLKKSLDTLEKTGDFKTIRKDIARLCTALKLKTKK